MSSFAETFAEVVLDSLGELVVEHVTGVDLKRVALVSPDDELLDLLDVGAQLDGQFGPGSIEVQSAQTAEVTSAQTRRVFLESHAVRVRRRRHHQHSTLLVSILLQHLSLLFKYLAVYLYQILTSLSRPSTLSSQKYTHLHILK